MYLKIFIIKMKNKKILLFSTLLICASVFFEVGNARADYAPCPSGGTLVGQFCEKTVPGLNQCPHPFGKADTAAINPCYQGTISVSGGMCRFFVQYAGFCTAIAARSTYDCSNNGVSYSDYLPACNKIDKTPACPSGGTLSGSTCVTCATSSGSGVSCAAFAPTGVYSGLPSNYTNGTFSWTYNSCTKVYTYTGGCSAPVAAAPAACGSISGVLQPRGMTVEQFNSNRTNWCAAGSYVSGLYGGTVLPAFRISGNAFFWCCSDRPNAYYCLDSGHGVPCQTAQEASCNASSISWSPGCSGNYSLIASEGSRIVSNTAYGYNGSTTASCYNGSITQSGNTCTVDCTYLNTSGSGLSCATYAPAGTYSGLPAANTVGTFSWTYNGCTGVYTYTGGCSAPVVVTTTPQDGVCGGCTTNPLGACSYWINSFGYPKIMTVSSMCSYTSISPPYALRDQIEKDPSLTWQCVGLDGGKTVTCKKYCQTLTGSGLSCATFAPAGTYAGLPATNTVGTFSWSYNSCTGVYTYTGGCSAPAVTKKLTVSAGTNGTVKSLTPDTAIDCNSANFPTCSKDYSLGTDVTLRASSISGTNFTGWSGACTNTAGDCLVTMDDVKNVQAGFCTPISCSGRPCGSPEINDGCSYCAAEAACITPPSVTSSGWKEVAP